MAEVENLVLEQLRLIRGDLARMDGRIDGIDGRLAAMASDMSDFNTTLQGTLLMMASLGGHVKHLADRVENLEQRIEGPAA